MTDDLALIRRDRAVMGAVTDPLAQPGLVEERVRRISRGLDDLLHALVDEDPVGAFETRAAFPGGSQTTVPVATAGLRAAMWIAVCARLDVKRWVLRARADGASWYDIADLLTPDIAPDGEAAFEWVAGPALESVRWTCRSCDERIMDRGPYSASPEENEIGHSDTCARQDDARHRAAREWAGK